jgi:valyl-tRNA synthetase
MTECSATPAISFARDALPKNYSPQHMESLIYQFWLSNHLFAPDEALQAWYDGQGQPVPDDISQVPHFSVVIPPPNVTGTLHMGHALDCTIQDIFTRWHRMLGHRTLWMPGMDHAGIATQTVVEKRLNAGMIDGYAAGTSRHELPREAFLECVWAWATACRDGIRSQFQRLGISPDWSRERFTLDEGLSDAVRKTFVTLYEKGLIYRGEYIVNWDPATQSAISDIETEYTDEQSHLWHITYPLTYGGGELTVATTRPETLFGDVAVAVNPKDERYAKYIGKTVILPLTGRNIPVIGDEYVEMEFGTGALKITPAHDPNDFDVAKRHSLSPIRIFNDKAELLPLEFIPEPLHGLERWAVREQVEALLEGQGYLQAKMPHQHRVGRAQRSGEVIEPLLSKQWFISTRPLADACLNAHNKGELQFVPERWQKDYLRWLENINDWCISRQLMWGHRIPAWYHLETGETYVGETAPPNETEWAQDPDVLDTWFSSGLWPFSTMGWPDETASDLQAFYPTSLLVTGFDIIFFWVARMTMFAHEITEVSPFSTVYIHGLIRDEKGQKMSKSKGNTIDPVEVIDEQGCDGFRFALTSLITYGGQDIKLSKDKLEQGRLFSNKLWNAARFVGLNLESGPIAETLQEALLTDMDRWVLGRYEYVVREANRLLSDSRLGEYAQLLLDFTWYQFCDWYIEYAKYPMKSEDDALKANTRRVLHTVLEGVLKLLHPIMPYITEALWQQLPLRRGVSISTSPFPQQPTLYFHNSNINEEVSFVLGVVRALRNIRQQYNVPPAKAVDVIFEVADRHDSRVLARFLDTLKHFVPLDSVTLEARLAQKPEQVATNVVGHCRILVPLAGLIDVKQEIGRLQKQQAALVKDQQKLMNMLNNPQFLERAGEEVVNKNRTQLGELNQKLRLLEEQLEGLL